MPVTTDIVRTWRRPRRVVRDLLLMGRREDRAILFLMVACGLIFVAQLPRLSREAFFDDTITLDERIAGAMMAWIVIAPLLFYGIAALSHIVARIVGGAGSWYSARLALFWALLSSSPAFLLYGLVAGFIGPGPQLTVAGIVLLGVFGTIWGLGLIEAERAPEAGR